MDAYENDSFAVYGSFILGVFLIGAALVLAAFLFAVCYLKILWPWLPLVILVAMTFLFNYGRRLIKGAIIPNSDEVTSDEAVKI